MGSSVTTVVDSGAELQGKEQGPAELGPLAGLRAGAKKYPTGGLLFVPNHGRLDVLFNSPAADLMVRIFTSPQSAFGLTFAMVSALLTIHRLQTENSPARRFLRVASGSITTASS